MPDPRQRLGLIYAATGGPVSPILIVNSGTIDPDIGISAETHDQGSPIDINNSGDVEGNRAGIAAYTGGGSSPITITNSGTATSAGTSFPSIAIGAVAIGDGSKVVIDNSGTARGYGAYGVGICAVAVGAVGGKAGMRVSW